MDNKMNSDRISYRQTRRNIIIFIDCIPRLVLPRRNFLFQSWVNSVTGDTSYPAGKKYTTEYYLPSGSTILTEYNNKEMWVDILNYLNKEL